jgi:hypothetical protein
VFILYSATLLKAFIGSKSFGMDEWLKELLGFHWTSFFPVSIVLPCPFLLSTQGPLVESQAKDSSLHQVPSEVAAPSSPEKEDIIMLPSGFTG